MKLDLTSDINKGYEAGLNYPQTDKFIVAVHWWSLAGLTLLSLINSGLDIAVKYFKSPELSKIAASYYESPFAWRVISPTEAIVAVAIGFLAALLPALLVGKFKNHYYWRLFVTLTLSMFAYLAVFVGGGSIEMHFLFFTMIALVVIYADWRLGWFMLILVALHHGILNYVAPTWVYFYGRNDFAIVAHAIPVVITVIFTTVISSIHRTTVQQIQAVRDDLKEINKELKSGQVK